MVFAPFTVFSPPGVAPGKQFAKAGANTSTGANTLGIGDITGPANLAPAGFVALTMSGTMAGDANVQLPLVSALQTQFSNVASSFVLRVINASSANHVWTVTTNTGWTLSGTMTIAQNTFRDFLVVNNGDGTATLTSVGTGTNS